MEARLELLHDNPLAATVVRHLLSADHACHDVIPAPTRELIKIRASQLNDCAFCLDMHTKDAAAAGEDPARINLVAAWRESTVFTEAERAALALTEQGTLIAAGGEVSDTAWEEARRHYDDRELTALVWLIASINAFNRINVMTRRPGGSYVPGQFG